jgi:hypothetical protein
MHNHTWIITQSQISQGDVEGAIRRVDPEQIPDDQIVRLSGVIRLRIEGARGLLDIVTDPHARKFFRALHARWPWAGYFLRLEPVTAASAPAQVIDLSVFMTLALCHLEQLTAVETAHGIGLHYDAARLREHVWELQIRAAELAGVLDLPLTFIAARNTLVARAVVSFFAAGRQLKP